MPAASRVPAPAVPAPAALFLLADGAAEHADDQPAVGIVSAATSAATKAQVQAQAGGSGRVTRSDDCDDDVGDVGSRVSNRRRASKFSNLFFVARPFRRVSCLRDQAVSVYVYACSLIHGSTVVRSLHGGTAGQ